MELYPKTVPKTAENFRQFCTGETKGRGGRPQGFKGCKFHRVVSFPPGACVGGGGGRKSEGAKGLMSCNR